jgi:hypothetical protein
MGIAGRAALLATFFAALAVVSLPVAMSTSGVDGIVASLSAAAVVWIASAAAMASGELCYGTHQAILKLLFGMTLRMLIPLVACLLVLMTLSRLANAGFAFYVLVFYLLALPVDTALAMLKPTTVAAGQGNRPN